ncbi:hypothetical protein WJX84_011281 [Apatococcus fuscideae]|uniref:Secreted protein n=1 Tax=Apatococcus fuscideae TaxID=2026836 RepID=A0AAW1THP6_9CHLO
MLLSMLATIASSLQVRSPCLVASASEVVADGQAQFGAGWAKSLGGHTLLQPRRVCLVRCCSLEDWRRRQS